MEQISGIAEVEGFWFIVVSEGIEDETETVDMPDGCHQGGQDIRRAIRIQNTLLKKNSALCQMDCLVRRPTLSCAAAKALPRASIINGRRSLWSLASSGLRVIRLGRLRRAR